MTTITPTTLEMIGFRYYPFGNERNRRMYYLQTHADMFVVAVFITGKFFYVSLRDTMRFETHTDVVLGGVTNIEQLKQFLCLLTGKDE